MLGKCFCNIISKTHHTTKFLCKDNARNIETELSLIKGYTQGTCWKQSLNDSTIYAIMASLSPGYTPIQNT